MAPHVCSECGAFAEAPGRCAADHTPLTPATDPLLGTEIARYRIARKLGQGGMGAVYLGVQPAIGSRVAIKVLSADCADDPDLVERFFIEARAVNLIRHEAIVDILDLSRLPDGRPFIVMEFVAGQTLGHLIRRSRPLLGGIASAMTEVLSALGAAHTIGIIHRDLKPDNVLITARGAAKVLDFGIAKLAARWQVQAAPRTQTGALLGTPAYMSPEQIANAAAIDPRSDLYAAGVVVFEAVTGRLPFTGSTYELMRAQAQDPPPPPRMLRPDLPASFEQIIVRALEKDPAQRFGSAAEMAHALTTAARALPRDQHGPLKLVEKAARAADATPGPSSAGHAGGGHAGGALPSMVAPSMVAPSMVAHSVVAPSVVAPSMVAHSVVAPSVVAPSVVAPSVVTPSVVAPSMVAHSVVAPSVAAASVVAPSVVAPSVVSPSVHSPSVYSPSVHSPSVHSPSVHSPSVHSPSVHSPTADLASVHSPSVHSVSIHSPSAGSASVYARSSRRNLWLGLVGVGVATLAIVGFVVSRGETPTSSTVPTPTPTPTKVDDDNTAILPNPKQPAKPPNAPIDDLDLTSYPELQIDDVTRTVKPKIVPTAFDVDAFLPEATELARQLAPDAALFEITAHQVRLRGLADLTTIPKGRKTYFAFVSVQAMMAKTPCLVVVEINADSTVSVGRAKGVCRTALERYPRCSLRRATYDPLVQGSPMTARYLKARDGVGWYLKTRSNETSIEDDADEDDDECPRVPDP